jgi:hypothetical protein
MDFIHNYGVYIGWRPSWLQYPTFIWIVMLKREHLSCQVQRHQQQMASQCGSDDIECCPSCQTSVNMVHVSDNCDGFTIRNIGSPHLVYIVDTSPASMNPFTSTQVLLQLDWSMSSSHVGSQFDVID